MRNGKLFLLALTSGLFLLTSLTARAETARGQDEYPVEAPPPAEAPPWKDESKEPAAPQPEPAAPETDTFHSDPLINAALEKFAGKVISE